LACPGADEQGVRCIYSLSKWWESVFLVLFSMSGVRV
jgi:hypothetical protein